MTAPRKPSAAQLRALTFAAEQADGVLCNWNVVRVYKADGSSFSTEAIRLGITVRMVEALGRTPWATTIKINKLFREWSFRISDDGKRLVQSMVDERTRKATARQAAFDSEWAKIMAESDAPSVTTEGAAHHD